MELTRLTHAVALIAVIGGGLPAALASAAWNASQSGPAKPAETARGSTVAPASATDAKVCSCCGALLAQAVPGGHAPATAVAPAQPATFKTIGVGAVAVTAGVAAASSAKSNSLTRVAEAMDGQIMAAFKGTRKFEVIGRSDLADILKESEFGASGLVALETAAQSGAIRGVDYILITTLDDFQDVQTEANYEAIGIKGTARQIRVSGVCKLYDPSTARVLDIANVQVEEIDRTEQRPGERRDGELSDKLLLKLARAAAERMAHRVVDVLYPAKIVALTDAQATLNRGDGTGIAVGQLWDAFALSEEIIDPDTGASLGREEARVGTLRITEVLPLTAKGEVVEGSRVAIQNIVRMKVAEKHK